jgi:hypothetical protein
MRFSWIFATVLIIVQLLVDLYLLSIALHRTHKDRWPRIQLTTALILLAYIITTICLPRRTGDNGSLLTVMWLLFGYLSVYISKISFIAFDLIASIPKLWHRKRLSAISWIGVVVSIAVFGTLWWGALINRFALQTHEVTIEVPGLPKSFEGFRIVQFSDLHVGTYGTDAHYVGTVVDSINALRPDAIFFTGDIVNRRSDELQPFVATLSRLHSPNGVYSILGNHDYGDYNSWASPQDKADNMELLYRLQRNMGWTLLRDSTAWIHRGNDSIAVIGVENWGDPPFPTYGDLGKAYPTLNDSNIKILLTHNPAHWTAAIKDNTKANVVLTLSGHTHAMQIDVNGISPAVWRYDTWGGRYNSTDRRRTLYVNIGIGTVGIPMRIGATPELTVITLTGQPRR